MGTIALDVADFGKQGGPTVCDRASPKNFLWLMFILLPIHPSGGEKFTIKLKDWVLGFYSSFCLDHNEIRCCDTPDATSANDPIGDAF